MRNGSNINSKSHPDLFIHSLCSTEHGQEGQVCAQNTKLSSAPPHGTAGGAALAAPLSFSTSWASPWCLFVGIRTCCSVPFTPTHRACGPKVLAVRTGACLASLLLFLQFTAKLVTIQNVARRMRNKAFQVPRTGPQTE